MNRFIAFLTGKPGPAACGGFSQLPESVAYSALLASGVEGACELSFAEFVATLEKRDSAAAPAGRSTH